MVVRVLAEAERDINEAFRYYISRSKAVGNDFLIEIEHTLSLIERHPQIGSPSERKTRRLRLKRFPYILWYRRDGESLVVLAVSHERRRPQLY